MLRKTFHQNFSRLQLILKLSGVKYFTVMSPIGRFCWFSPPLDTLWSDGSVFHTIWHKGRFDDGDTSGIWAFFIRFLLWRSSAWRSHAARKLWSLKQLLWLIFSAILIQVNSVWQSLYFKSNYKHLFSVIRWWYLGEAIWRL